MIKKSMAVAALGERIGSLGVLAAFATALLVAGMGAPAQAGDLMDTLRSQRQFSTFIRLVDLSGEIQRLRSAPDITLFVPRDSAFNELPGGAILALEQPENIDRLRRFVLVHAVARRVPDSEIAGKEFDLKSFEGTTLRIDADDGETMIEFSKIVGGEIIVDNGFVHMIDRVLVPQ